MAVHNPHFAIQVIHRISDIDPIDWDRLSGERPFQSCRWYQYGERAMSDSQPLYIILSLDDQPVARGTFWLVREEPIPIKPPARTLVQAALRRRPLLICRSPFSSLPGFILPGPPLRDRALEMLSRAAIKEVRRLTGSFLIFDYLENNQAAWTGWPSEFVTVTVSDPGTMLALQWETFEDYLVKNKWRMHQHYKRSSRSAADLGIRVTRHDSAGDLNAALALIRNVERRHESAPNPWARGMLENMVMMEHTWLEAHIGSQLVGCLLLLEDNGVQIATLPGLTEGVPFAYFMLLYEAIQKAFEKKLTALRWGSGAYETKRRLGFELETNNNAVFMSANPLVNFIMQNLVRVLL